MTKAKQKPNLYLYSDYRIYLRDWYEISKRSLRGFSYRSFSKKAGYASPNFLKLVMDGDRNLTEESIVPMIKGLELDSKEQEFFRNLVFYNQASNDSKRNHYYQKLMQSKKFNEVKSIENGEFDYCSTWYHAVIRELIAAKDFDGTPEWLVQRIYPAITVAQATKSLELLSRLGFIQKVTDTLYKQSQTLLSTGAEVISHALFQYHQNMLEISKDVLEKLPAADRDISSLTLGISKNKIGLIKKMIADFRSELLKAVGDVTAPEDVIQVNIQMFPFTKQEIGRKSA